MNNQNISQTETTEKVFLSEDPNKAMQEMMDTIDRLRGVYVRETEALENSDTIGFLSVQEEKLNTARLYQDSVEQVLLRKEEMKNAAPSLKKRLEEMQMEFSALTKKNMTALRRMQRSTERLGDIIRTAAQDAAQGLAVNYTETGAIQKNNKKSVSIGISETA